ncbi:hypothetical protein ACHAXR_005018 [Thalassiosira sp. AJA248-18]
MAKAVPILMKVDFSSLNQPRLDYAEQKEIPVDRVILMTACAVHYGLDFGLVVRYLGHEYTGESRNLQLIKDECGPHIEPEDLAQIIRILTKGCPAELNYEMPYEMKMRMLRRGNQKSVLENDKEVRETMNKEEKHCHVVPFISFVVRFAYTGHHVSQGMVLKLGKDPRLVWDGSTKLLPDDIVMNDIVPLLEEANITFGRSKDGYLTHIYNIRISYPNEDIDLANADIKAAHRYPRINPSLSGAFGFLIQGMYYFIATAMVFGAIVSATSWEPFRRAIEVMTAFSRHDHDSTSCSVPCEINKGVLDEEGNQKPIPNFIYVDDCLLASVRRYTRRALAGCIEAIFVVLGYPATLVRQCPLAINKWRGMHVGHEIVSIGLVFNSRLLTVGITREYLAEVLQLLNDEWPTGFPDFQLKSIVTLAGKLARLAEGAPWVFHLMSHIYSSIAHALRANEKFLLGENAQFKKLITSIKELRKLPRIEQEVNHMNFYIRKAAKQKFKSSIKYTVNKTLTEEIELLRAWLAPTSGISWAAAIGHVIKRTPFATSPAPGDACCYGGGGFSLELRFWWHLVWPKKIYHRTKVFIENDKDGKLISINVLEFVAIIINYAAALTAIETDGCDDPYPVLLNMADNMSSVRWTNHGCKSSLSGRALARLFCMLLVNSRLGINAKWLSTKANFIADDISRINKSDNKTSFNFAELKQRYPQLADCRAFQPSRELLSLIWQTVLTKKSPSLETVQTLKQRGLGKLIS